MRSRFFKPVDVVMEPRPTPPSLVPTSRAPPHLPTIMTEMMTKGVTMMEDDGDFAALIGGIISAVLLGLICVLVLLLWCLSRQKGSYTTNEMDDDDEDNNDSDDEERSVSSDMALQSKEPLKDKEEE